MSRVQQARRFSFRFTTHDGGGCVGVSDFGPGFLVCRSAETFAFCTTVGEFRLVGIQQVCRHFVKRKRQVFRHEVSAANPDIHHVDAQLSHLLGDVRPHFQQKLVTLVRQNRRQVHGTQGLGKAVLGSLLDLLNAQQIVGVPHVGDRIGDPVAHVVVNVQTGIVRQNELLDFRVGREDTLFDVVHRAEWRRQLEAQAGIGLRTLNSVKGTNHRLLVFAHDNQRGESPENEYDNNRNGDKNSVHDFTLRFRLLVQRAERQQRQRVATQ